MRIIEGKTMICNTCGCTIEYNDNEILQIPNYPCMGCIVCPTCGQQIIMVAGEFEPAKERIIVEEGNNHEE